MFIVFLQGMFSEGLMHGCGVFTQAGGLKCEVGDKKDLLTLQ